MGGIAFDENHLFKKLFVLLVTTTLQCFSMHALWFIYICQNLVDDEPLMHIITEKKNILKKTFAIMCVIENDYEDNFL